MDRLQENLLRLGSQMPNDFAPLVYESAKEAAKTFPLPERLRHPDVTLNREAVSDVAAFALLQALTTLTERTARSTLSPLEANVALITGLGLIRSVCDALNDGIFTNISILAQMPEDDQRTVCEAAVRIFGDPPSTEG